MVNRAINRFSRLLSLNTWLSETCGLKGISCIDSCNLFRGCRHFFRADLEFKYRWTIFGSACDAHRSGRRWCILTRGSLGTAETKHHSLQCQHVDKWLMNLPPNSNSIHTFLSPALPLLGFAELRWKRRLTLQSLPRRLFPPQASTFCDTNLADDDDNKCQEAALPHLASHINTEDSAWHQCREERRCEDIQGPCPTSASPNMPLCSFSFYSITYWPVQWTPAKAQTRLLLCT